MPQHSLSARGVQVLRVMLQAQDHLSVGIDDQGQRKIGLANVFEMPVGPFATLSAQRRIQQIVLKDQNAVEQAYAARYLAGFLYGAQRSRLVRPQREVLFADLAQP